MILVICMQVNCARSPLNDLLMLKCCYMYLSCTYYCRQNAADTLHFLWEYLQNIGKMVDIGTRYKPKGNCSTTCALLHKQLYNQTHKSESQTQVACSANQNRTLQDLSLIIWLPGPPLPYRFRVVPMCNPYHGTPPISGNLTDHFTGFSTKYPPPFYIFRELFPIDPPF